MPAVLRGALRDPHRVPHLQPAPHVVRRPDQDLPPPLPPARLRRGPHAPRGMRTATRSNPSLPLRLARTRLLNRNPNPKPAPNTSPSHPTLPTRARTVTAGRARPAAPRRARSRPPARERRRARGPPGGAPLLRLRRGAAPRRGLRVPALPPRVLHRVRRVPARDAAHVPGVPDAQTVAGDGGERFSRLEPARVGARLGLVVHLNDHFSSSLGQ